MKAFQNNYENNETKFINADKASKEILSIPIGPHLKIKDAEYVSNAIQSFFFK
jgi:dTDP-4-amino-4,6-dideoxygalactose transaminase